MFIDDRYSEAHWRRDADFREQHELKREARDLAEYFAETPAHNELPAVMQDDAGPIGMSCEVDYRRLAVDLLKEVA